VLPPGLQGGLHIIGLDPNLSMESYAMENTRRAGLVDGAVSIITGVAEEIPLEDSSVDAVVGTLVMCSVPDVPLALQEIQRVLKPGGRYLFIEVCRQTPL